ncbi:hypothetical protein EWB00_000817 [Schistosoma japonicum]|uniref:Uncharacterized protein n=1 Tax=Schistosoma japonicum TaxID=6182 RepID=A0A4Z2CK68_SCHJA|nr:hypothetical protein EWB00_000817 [Schistosoma japonicum]
MVALHAAEQVVLGTGLRAPGRPSSILRPSGEGAEVLKARAQAVRHHKRNPAFTLFNMYSQGVTSGAQPLLLVTKSNPKASLQQPELACNSTAA